MKIPEASKTEFKSMTVSWLSQRHQSATSLASCQAFLMRLSALATSGCRIETGSESMVL